MGRGCIWPSPLTVAGRAGEVLPNLAMSGIGYPAGAAFRGRGLARRAAAVMTFYAHHPLGMTQVRGRAQIEPDNHASIAVAEKNRLPPQRRGS